MKTVWKGVRGILILVVPIVLTTLAINATDNLGNLSESLLGSVISSDQSKCDDGMVFVVDDAGGFCIDMFEASPSAACTFSDPQNQDNTRLNLENGSCKAESKENTAPWRNIAQHQAELACRNAGKRLPNNKEWYQASLGTPDSRGNVERNDCNVRGSQVARSGTHDRCVSSSGAYDMVGNAWEWVNETVTDGVFEGTTLPEEGYVTGISSDGIPVTTRGDIPDQNFNEDYLWVEENGVRGMIRGGYWRSGTDGGQYALNVITPPSFAGVGVGFRCVK